ncbi:trypsin, alkaline B-like isoform X2 [Trichoplusia ni]|uniref:trypsin n=1 Tax=Trichoplusia ni TaxID=7111 RepID=A0A7E5WG25_TRINI|nr:trypsin, alkaline B-like isoform X2 [Trichoplusia ni]
MRLLALLVFCCAAVSAVPSDRNRIVGGSTVNISSYPSLAALLFTPDWINFRHNCGGIILNNRAILTAAHCTVGSPPGRWRVRVGSSLANSGGVVHNTAAIINHPNYGQGGHPINNDIAVLRLSTNIAFNNNARAGSIAGSNYIVPDNSVVWTAGWGHTSSGGSPSEQLRHVQVWTVNQSVCNARYGGITDSMLCAGWLDVGGRDSCQNDSGGPLYHNGVVVGVVSFGYGCGDPTFPGVYARVSRFTSWIQSNA